MNLNVFDYDQGTGTVILNSADLALIKEFKTLIQRDKKRADKEFTYIYLAIDWKSPYSNYSEQERHEAALQDASITEEEWNDPDFRAACRKYRELQNSSRSLKLIKAAEDVVDKITDYFETLDLQERDPISGKPIFKTKDVMAELSNVSDVVEQLKALEVLYKREQEQDNGLMGNVEIGAFD